ncbi:1-(5-phosphoribosyl)-5-amino-4-imidazole-carboxylate carboxylase, partial [bacterium]|nr:1-(5-phosphoribosyl)-5-amino-4-imidazole-carboxylate carboxylase [bacterium]
MQTEAIKLLLEQVKTGAVDVDAAMEQLRHLPYEAVDNFALLDHHRSMRNGFPEVIFAQGKTPSQVAAIAQKLAERSDKVLITRSDQTTAEVVLSALPEMTYHPIPRLIILDRSVSSEKKPGIMVCSAGTADMPVAEEAA